MIEYDKFTPEQFLNLNEQQAEAIAEMVNRISRQAASSKYEAFALSYAIEHETDFDVVELVERAFGKDVIAESLRKLNQNAGE